ncbi:hypothetical protein JHK82_026576 [Glycine max]|nr:hypothetical protein JHK87_026463 [Glycine soja]KAG5002561.1 hypothetical protein JHK86_026700 [Glycine max]KAG5125741.1 hypothetical protein JHK82_026576 [Glycine max]KAG5150341.1 hypothetical protein JHK84_026813 [Glycine max]KAH1227142.1 hypothetical protein GmHk_10G027456 [Glycine max]
MLDMHYDLPSRSVGGGEDSRRFQILHKRPSDLHRHRHERIESGNSDLHQHRPQLLSETQICSTTNHGFDSGS